MRTTIVITSHNYARYIERCVRSCLNQRLVRQPPEIIVVDDHSSDDTTERLQKFQQNENFSLVVTEQNVGVAEAANVGIRQAASEFVVRVDADDYVSERFVFFLSEYLKANKHAFGVACDYLLVDETERSLERRSAAEWPISCGILYRRDLLIAAGLYDSDFRHREEEELRMRLGAQYHLEYLKMPLYRYRMHKTNKTKHPDYHAFAERLSARTAEITGPALQRREGATSKSPERTGAEGA